MVFQGATSEERRPIGLTLRSELPDRSALTNPGGANRTRLRPREAVGPPGSRNITNCTPSQSSAELPLGAHRSASPIALASRSLTGHSALLARCRSLTCVPTHDMVNE